jgi:hypothetical protein
MTSRRRFIQILPLAGASVLATRPAWSQAANMVDEKSPQAAALGYVADAAKVDAGKFKQYKAGQLCSNCALYQGKPSDAAAGCPLFAGKQVAGKGWCSAYAKKA